MKIKLICCLLLVTFISALAQGQTTVHVTGTVSGESDQPLQGVTIKVKASAGQTFTDSAGIFRIDLPSADAILEVSSVGYISQEVPVNGQASLFIRLVAQVKSLEDVVVVGYGTQRKKDVTGSVSSISENEFKKVAVTSVDQGIQGRSAGVQVTASNGQPGAGASIRIRGGNSINGGNEPLYVIDGFPVSSPPGSGALLGPASNPLATLNPNDIVSIDILKDASATAIYGSRGANGVVLITTRRGKAEQNKITFDAYYGVQKVRNSIPMLNAKDYAILANESEFNAGNGANVRYRQSYIDSIQGPGTDWADAILREAPMQNYSITASGGTAKTQYAMSFNYFDQKGIILNSGFKRGSFRVNLDSRLTDKLKVGNSIAFSYTRNDIVNNDESVTGITYAALAFNPLQAVYQPDGSYTFASAPLNSINNPVALAREVDNFNLSFRAIGTVFAEYEFIKGLRVKISIGGDFGSIRENYYANSKVTPGIDAVNGNGLARVGNVTSKNWLNENTITYDKSFNSRHTINALAGFTIQSTTAERNLASARGFPNDNLKFYSLGAAQTTLPSTSNFTEGIIQSYLGRINYSLDHKYLLTLTSRVDGSSRFGSGNKYGFFPSGSIAWRLSEEDFIKDMGAFSDLKLRVSYGKTGNQDIAAYQSLSSLGTVQYTYGNNVNTGFAPGRIANPELKWETTAQTDIGIDMSVLNNRINLIADFYYKKTKDLLLDISVPWSSGFTSGLKNIGSVENKGFEIAVNTENIRGVFNWSSSLNFSINRNKVLDLGGLDMILNNNITSGLNGGVAFSVLKVGEPIGSFYGYRFDGLYQTPAEVAAANTGATALLGYMRYEDINGDKILDGNDRTVIGSAQPKFIAGLTNNFSYKGFDLNIFLQGSYGNKILFLHRIDLESMKAVNNGSAVSLTRWTGPGTTNYMPRAYRQAPREPVSSRLVENGSYLRCRNLTLGYTLPGSALKSIGLKFVRLYVSAQNLFTITDYTGFDPEVSAYGQNNLAPGVDLSTYPSSKTFLFGLNIEF